MCLCFGCGGVGGVGGEWHGGLGKGICGEVSDLDSLCRSQGQVSVYCASRIPAHLRCTQCWVLLHLIDVCFLVCIFLEQTSQIQICVFVGPGLVSTSPAFVRSRANHTAGTCGCLAQKTVNRAPIAGGRSGECRLYRRGLLLQQFHRG